MATFDSTQSRSKLTTLIAILLGLTIGCSAVTAGKNDDTFPINPEGSQITKAELRIRVRSLALPFSGIIEEAADSVIAETTDPEVRKLALLWKINGIPSMQAALFQSNPLAALLDAWALNIQTRNSVESGLNSEILPDNIKSIALQALNKMGIEITGIARLLGPAEAVDELRQDVEAWAEAHPIDRSQATRTPTSGELARLTADNKVGIRRTVAAANESMSDLAIRMDVYTAFMPKQARWQAEYLMAQMVNLQLLTLQEETHGPVSVAYAAALLRVGRTFASAGSLDDAGGDLDHV